MHMDTMARMSVISLYTETLPVLWMVIQVSDATEKRKRGIHNEKKR